MHLPLFLLLRSFSQLFFDAVGYALEKLGDVRYVSSSTNLPDSGSSEEPQKWAIVVSSDKSLVWEFAALEVTLRIAYLIFYSLKSLEGEDTYYASWLRTRIIIPDIIMMQK